MFVLDEAYISSQCMPIACFVHWFCQVQSTILELFFISTEVLNGELVVLHIKLSMFDEVFGACLESVWKFERRTFYIGSLEAKLILALLGMPN